ncbi:MAG: response regulator [Chitinophagaceae bacterium]
MKDRKLSILIVDDNRYFLKRMMEMLKGLDSINDITTACNYEEAFSKIDTKEHDLVLLDIHLPDGNGMNLLKAIKDSPARTEVIMVSNSSCDYYRKQCKELGAFYFLDKTNDFEMMPALLTEFHSC